MNYNQKILFTNDVKCAIHDVIEEMAPASVHIITDSDVKRLVLPALGLPDCHIQSFPPGDGSKDVEVLARLWQGLSSAGATRHSVVVNIGGGVVTDLGGFAAATFKRGVRFVNVPTTLLGAVDAAVGGKTGINLGNLKNEVGAFAPADYVIISASLFSTLPEVEILSGYAEMVKHALLSSTSDFHASIATDPLELSPEAMLALLESSVQVKRRIVLADPTEKGLRKALNLGHTAGHAFESLALRRGRPMPHGFAVAHGMMVEMIISHMLYKFPGNELHLYRDFMRSAGYGTTGIECADYKELLEFMRHDKKNETAEAISFTLLKAPGEPLTGITVPAETILSALDIYREML